MQKGCSVCLGCKELHVNYRNPNENPRKWGESLAKAPRKWNLPFPKLRPAFRCAILLSASSTCCWPTPAAPPAPVADSTAIQHLASGSSRHQQRHQHPMIRLIVKVTTTSNKEQFTAKVAAKAGDDNNGSRKWKPCARKRGESGGESTLGLEHRRNQVFDAAQLDHNLLVAVTSYQKSPKSTDVFCIRVISRTSNSPFPLTIQQAPTSTSNTTAGHSLAPRGLVQL